MLVNPTQITLTMTPHMATRLQRALLDGEARLPANHTEERETLKWAHGRVSTALFEYADARADEDAAEGRSIAENDAIQQEWKS